MIAWEKHQRGFWIKKRRDFWREFGKRKGVKTKASQMHHQKNKSERIDINFGGDYQMNEKILASTDEELLNCEGKIDAKEIVVENIK